ncbi:MAG TPA: ketol-acid reductoisomerase, partial [Gammaproteobacteria bacterium]|nr:ketol-acid reductoisomerase [Gammaproteobacteria bacterium]
KAEMKRILSEIQSGEFANEWMAESRSGGERFKQLRAEAQSHPIEDVGARLRSMMPWIQKGKLVDKDVN